MLSCLIYSFLTLPKNRVRLLVTLSGSCYVKTGSRKRMDNRGKDWVSGQSSFYLFSPHDAPLMTIHIFKHFSKRCVVTGTTGIMIFFNCKENMTEYSAELRLLHYKRSRIAFNWVVVLIHYAPLNPRNRIRNQSGSVFCFALILQDLRRLCYCTLASPATAQPGAKRPQKAKKPKHA